MSGVVRADGLEPQKAPGALDTQKATAAVDVEKAREALTGTWHPRVAARPACFT